MKIEIRHSDRSVSDALQEFAHRRFARALRPFQQAVSRADVRIEDVNGERGGIDTECKVAIELATLDQPVVVTAKGADAYYAVQAACARLHEAVSRALARNRRLDRFGVSSATAIPSGTAPVSGPGTIAASADPVDEESHITVTTADLDRLRKVIAANRNSRDRDAAEALADELDRAQVVPAESIADTVVTMNSRVVFRNEETGESREMSLVYPARSDPGQGRISVLAPVGTALLGLSVGQTIDWPLPQGELKRYRVVAVLYQPEAAGDLHL